MFKILKYILVIIGIIVGIFGLFLTYITFTDYKPDYKDILQENTNPDIIADTAELSLMSWNIGYCGLNAEMDFFYSGGHQVYPSEDVVVNNLEGVKRTLKNSEYADFVLLQEVDESAQRSYFTNQVDSFDQLYKHHYSSFAYNYNVKFVPVPVTKPMGSVKGGLQTLSRYNPKMVCRYSYEGNFDWPTSLFMLDRCFIVNRYPVNSGNELLIINTHNSAYDNGGLRKAQMLQIKDFVTQEYAKGNYVIVGGDWNQCAPGFKANFSKDVMDYNDNLFIDDDLFDSNWTWFYDNKVPTNRRNSTAYKQGETLTTVIDFYLLSPNINGVTVNNIEAGFIYTDHQAVKATVKLLPKR